MIGSGPAGLAAAQQLTRAGHEVVVLERADRIGGLLRYGIPEFKMEKRHIDRRLAQMEAEGTEFRTNAVVGETVDIEVLRASHDAIVLACGATDWRDLPIPGRELGGIHQAMEYLPHANRVQLGDIEQSPIDVHGKHVVIIGGGDTGADCLGTAHRQGAASVTQLEIMPRPPDARGTNNPWPQFAMVYKITSAHEEGGDRLFSVNTERFVDDGDGRVRALVAPRGRDDRRQRSPRSKGPSRRSPPTSCSSPSASSDPEHGSWLDWPERRLRRPRQRRPRRSVHELAARHLRRRRHGPRAEPHRVGDRRRSGVRRGRRRVPDGRVAAAVAGPPDRPPAHVTRRARNAGIARRVGR